jgi:glycosyltransferase involved in cell wall biosynthesis
MKIVVVTTLYNAAEYVERSIMSIMTQKYDNFVCYITDDMSTDNSVELVKDLIKDDPRFILIENTKKFYQPGNYDQVIRHNENVDDEDIIVEVDGDDWLPNRSTFNRIVDVYNGGDVWIANGSFIYSNGRAGFAAPPRNIENIRRETFTASHMRTWKAFLWREIEEDYLKDDDGQYWSVSGDLAFMYPMIEMSGAEHYRFMTEINYVYNEENPLNDHKVNMSSVSVITNKIRNRPPYTKLTR